MPPPTPRPDSNAFPLLEKILKLFKERGVLTSQAEIDAVRESFQNGSFWIKGEWRKKVLERVKESIRSAMDEGLPYSEWQKTAKEILKRFNDGTYAELVFRTNVTNARATGRYEMMFEPNRMKVAPYWKFSAFIDSKNDTDEKCPDTRCQFLDQRVFAKSDEAAKAFLPPLHFECRCRAIGLPARMVTGIVTKGSSLPFEPVEGWDGRRFTSLDGMFGG